MNNFTELVDKMLTNNTPSRIFMACLAMRTVEYWQNERIIDGFTINQATSFKQAFNSKECDEYGTQALFYFSKVSQ